MMQKKGIQDVFSAKEFTGFVYSPELFQMRLKEEILRTNRNLCSFLYIKIPTRHYDIFGIEHRESSNVKAWEIAVLTILNQTDVLDVKGYLEDDTGLGVIFLNSDADFVQTLKGAILRNLKSAGLLEKIRLRPKQPLFQVFLYSGAVESDKFKQKGSIQAFNHVNEGFLTIEYLSYSQIRHNRWNKRIINLAKRCFDLVASSSAIIVLSPFLIGIALVVRINGSTGSIIFKQVRVGLNGQFFTMYKFRSMYSDAEERLKELQKYNEVDGPVFKMKNDPRVFPIGRIIRKYSLDELPQLFNILKGDMTIVGPRPPIPMEVAEYLPWHKMRLAVKPGLTCHWQVSGRSNIGFDEWMRLDNKYVRHGNLNTDVDLIRRTFKVVFKGDGAH